MISVRPYVLIFALCVSASICRTSHSQPASSPTFPSLKQSELENYFLKGQRRFVDFTLAERWNGRFLSSTGEEPILFQNCHFPFGIEFLNLMVAGPITFDSCTFGSLIDETGPNGTAVWGPKDNLIQSCYLSEAIRFRKCIFYWDTRFFDTVVGGLFTIEDGIHNRKFRVEKCSFASGFRLANTRFDNGVLIEAADFTGSVDVTGSEFAEAFELQKTHLSSDLILQSATIGDKERPRPLGQVAVRLINTTIAGEFSANHLVFEPTVSAKLLIQDCTIANIRGFTWRDFRTVFVSADAQNEAEVLAQLRRSFLQLGQSTDAGETLLAMKANEAKRAGYFGKVFDRIMLYSSGWGTSPWLLMCWFAAIVGFFTLAYMAVVMAHLGLGQFAWILPKCLVLSISVTMLQHDPDDVRDLCKRKRRLGAQLRNLMTGHKIIASLFLMLVAGYVGYSLGSS
jgi:hypothetical protein